MDICSTNGLLPANSNIIDCIKSDKYKKNGGRNLNSVPKQLSLYYG